MINLIRIIYCKYVRKNLMHRYLTIDYENDMFKLTCKECGYVERLDELDYCQ